MFLPIEKLLSKPFLIKFDILSTFKLQVLHYLKVLFKLHPTFLKPLYANPSLLSFLQFLQTSRFTPLFSEPFATIHQIAVGPTPSPMQQTFCAFKINVAWAFKIRTYNAHKEQPCPTMYATIWTRSAIS